MSNEELIEQIRSGGDRAQLLGQLYDQNRGLIYQTVRPFQGSGGSDIDDLMQSAFFGLCEAADRYDPDKGTQFTTYLRPWVRAAVGKSQSIQGLERLPDFMRQRVLAYRRAATQWQQLTGTAPDDAVMRSRLRITQEQLEQLRKVMRSCETVSLAAPVPGVDDITLEDAIPDPRDRIGDLCETLDTETDAAILWGEVDALDPRQAAAIRTKFIEGLTASQVAEQLHLTRSQVNDAITRGCSKLRRKRRIKQIAMDHGYSTGDLYGGSLGRWRHSGMSNVEAAVIRRLEPD